MVLEIDRDSRVLYVHVLDVGSSNTVNRFYHEVAVIEHLLHRAFERQTDWRQA